MRISALGSKEIQAVILRLKGADRAIAKQVRAATKREIDPMWREAVRGRIATRLETRVLSDTARVAVSDQNITLKSAAVGKSLSGGARPFEVYAAVEFGADRAARHSYTANSRKGNPYKVKNRRTQAQFRPRNYPRGYVVYSAIAEVIPRVASLWVATTVRTFHELIEDK